MAIHHAIVSGGEAELAGVQVGDKVLEVNGQDCSKGMDVTKLMELKMLVQQVMVKGENPMVSRLTPIGFPAFWGGYVKSWKPGN